MNSFTGTLYPVMIHTDNGNAMFDNSLLQDKKDFYSINGILEYLQTEWTKMNIERSQWDAERSKLQAKHNINQIKCKEMINLKNNLLRRIKMLEYALLQERYKNKPTMQHRDHEQSEENYQHNFSIKKHLWDIMTKLEDDIEKDFSKAYTDNSDDLCLDDPSSNLNEGIEENLKKDQKTYPIFDILAQTDFYSLPIPTDDDFSTDPETIEALLEFDKLVSQQASLDPLIKFDNSPFISNKLSNSVPITSKDVRSTFIDWDSLDEQELLIRFKAQYRADRSKMSMSRVFHESFVTPYHKPYLDFKDSEGGNDESSNLNSVLGSDIRFRRMDQTAFTPSINGFTAETFVSDELDGVSHVFDAIMNEQREIAHSTETIRSVSSSSSSASSNVTSNTTESCKTCVSAPLCLEDLSSLTVSENMDSSRVHAVAMAMDNLDGVGEIVSDCTNELNKITSSMSSQSIKSTPWVAKYTLRSHFDTIRAIQFHPIEPILLTGSEDHTLKLWNLNKTIQAKKSTNLDVEPIYTFRGHNAPVLSLAMVLNSSHSNPNSNSSLCIYSGDLDGQLRSWRVPNSNLDPYDTFDPNTIGLTLHGHTNAIWSLSIRSDNLLLSVSADETARLWRISLFDSPIAFHVYEFKHILNQIDGISNQIIRPTSSTFLQSNTNHFVTGFSSGHICLIDLETNKLITCIQAKSSKEIPNASNKQRMNMDSSYVMSVLSHPHMPLVISAYEDGQIRLFDLSSGKFVYSMVGHSDAVTSLSMDSKGLQLLSGSHDCSIRLWDMNNRTCIQEITSHRKKFYESTNAVACHPTKSFIASAGSDALGKVFV